MPLQRNATANPAVIPADKNSAGSSQEKRRIIFLGSIPSFPNFTINLFIWTKFIKVLNSFKLFP